MIRIPQVRVVDENGDQLGVMPTPQALAIAQERGLDLVEVAPMAAPPVVRFLDFGQYKYELTKREKEAKRKQRSVTFKEVRLKPKIGIGDFDTKVRRAIEFLEEGDRIKVAVQFRGRELTHPEIGRNLLTKFVDQIKDHGVVERSPLLEGKSMHITVASVHKPKAIEHVSKHGTTAEDETEPATLVLDIVSEVAAVAAIEPLAAAATPDSTKLEIAAPAAKATVAPKRSVAAKTKTKITTDGAVVTASAPKPAAKPVRSRTIKAEPEAPAAAPAGE
jgi:translation initiation factor IF-3